MGWFGPRLSYWLQQERRIQQNSLIFCPDQDSFAVLPGSGQLYCCWDQNDSFTVLSGSGQFYCSVGIRTVLLFCQDQDSFTVLSHQKASFTVLFGSEGQLYWSIRIQSFTVLSGSGQFHCSVRIRRTALHSVGIRRAALLFCLDERDSFSLPSGSAWQLYHFIRISRAVLPFCQDLLSSFNILSGSVRQFYQSVRICRTVIPFCQDMLDSFTILSGSAEQF